MLLSKVALIFDNQVRPDTTGVYCRRALGALLDVEHFLPSELEQIPRHGFDLYLNIDDGLEYRLPADLRPAAWWAIDTHLNYAWCRDRARDFDFVFTAQRDGAEGFRTDGIRAAAWLPLACDPAVHAKHDVPKQHDLCFVGHLFPGPRQELVELLQRRFPRMLVGQRFFEEMARTYSESRIVFNRSLRNDVNMRVFEALACGSLLLTNDLRDNGQAELFQDGEHLAVYRDPDELLDKAAFYLRQEKAREKIAAAGRAEALARHTYRHRMEKLLVTLEEQLPARRAQAVVPDDMPGRGATTGEESWTAQVPATARRVLIAGWGVLSLAATLKAQRPQLHVTVIEGDPSPQPSGAQGADAVLTGDPEQPGTVFEPASFDCFLGCALFERLGEPVTFLRRVAEWLTPGGRVLALLPTLRRHDVLRALLDGHWTTGPAGALPTGQRQGFTRREIEKLCDRSGLTLESLEGLPGPGHADWQARGRPSEVHVGALHLTTATPEDAEELYLTGYRLTARAEPRPCFGLTSIVIPVHNQLAFTRLCLESLRCYTDEPIEVIVVDNGSTDGTAEYLQAQMDVRVLTNTENRGFPAAANQGMRAAQGQQILLLNNDTVVTTSWLRRLLTALASDPRIGLVGPCSNCVSGTQQVPIAYEDLSSLDGFAWDWGKVNAGRLEDTDRLIGFCLLLRREVVERVGYLDERFGLGCFEDDDYCLRTLQAGYRCVIARAAFVHHFGGRTFVGNQVDYASLLQHNQTLFQEKWQASSDQVVSTEQAPAARSNLAPQHVLYTLRPAPTGGLLLQPSPLLLTLCMIVRDNAGTLAACLQSIKPWVDEMVIVDTGSRDETPRLAEELGARVFHFPWCDDFSAARNESLRHARGRWLFWMDSDDTIPPECGKQLRELVRQGPPPEVFGFIVQVHCPGPGTDGQNDITVVDHVKLFRNLPALRFEGRLHEQILPAIRRLGGETAWTDLYVVHSGYDHSPEGQERKKQRDLRLLHLELQERPDHPFTLFNLGMTYADVGEPERAVGFLERSIACSGPAESHLRKAYALLVYCHNQLGQAGQAQEVCASGLRLFPEDVELRFRKAILLHEAGQLEAAIRLYEEILHWSGERHFTSIDRGIRGFKARQNLAAVYADLGDWARAEEQWRRVTEEVPRYRQGWQGLADVLLRQDKQDQLNELTNRLLKQPGLEAEGRLQRSALANARQDISTARRELERGLQDFPRDLDLHQAYCRLLFEHGPPAEAEQALRHLLQLLPQDAAAHHNLGTICLRQERPQEAARAFRQSLRYRPCSPVTVRQLAHALTACGQTAEARAAWEQLLQLCPDDVEALTVLGRLAERKGNTPEPEPRETLQEKTYTSGFAGRRITAVLATRGPVDEAIIQDIWQRDVYGLQTQATTPKMILDIGAHLGAFAVLTARLWPQARVVACEPDPDNLRLLKRNLHSCPRVEVVEAAIVGEDVASVPFHAIPDKVRGNSGGGSYVRLEAGSVLTQVPAVAMQRLWEALQLAFCDLLKLDCEGAELPILANLARARLLGRVGSIVGEWHMAGETMQEREQVLHQLAELLVATHEVSFQPHRHGREGYFHARRRAN